MASAVIGALRVNLSADTAAFSRGLTTAERRAQAFNAKISGVVKGLAKFTAAVTAAGAALATVLVKSSLETIDTQAKLARRVDGTTAAIQALQQAGDLAGISNEKLTKSLENLTTRLGEAQRRGMGPAAEALERIGLSASDLINLDVDQRVAAIADRFEELNLTAAQQADILRDLGVRNKEILNLLEGGGDATRAARKEVEQLGIAVSDIDAAKIEAANDALTRVGKIIRGVANQISVQLSPFILAAAEQLQELGTSGIDFGSIFTSAIEGAIRAVFKFLDALEFIRRAALGIGFLTGAIKVTREEIDKLGQTRLPSAGLDAFFTKIRTRAEEVAKALADAAEERRKLAGEGLSDDGEGSEAAQRLQEQLQLRLETLQQSLLTERELELATFAQRLADLEGFHQAGLISAQEFADLRAQVERDHADKLKKIDDDIAQRRRQNQARQVQDFQRLGNQINSVLGTLFGDSKAFAIADAIINTAQAITKTLAVYGATPFGLAQAAVAAAAGAAQIATIRKTTKSSGGGGAGPTAAASATQPPPTAPETTGGGGTLNLTIEGEQFGREQVRELAEQLIEFQRDGGTVVLAS